MILWFPLFVCGVIATSNAAVQQLDEEGCSELPLIKNGEISSPPARSSVDSIAYFTCNPGFVLRGSNAVQCMAARKWQIDGFCGKQTKLPEIEALQVELRNASRYGNLAKLNQLVEPGILDVNWRMDDDLDRTRWPYIKNASALLHAAFYSPNAVYDVVRFLVENGADINMKESYYNLTAHIYAALNGQTETVKFLLDRGANVNEPSMDTYTALIMAAKGGFPATCQLLLDRGAMIDVRTKVGFTPLIFAAQNGHFAVVKLLLDRGAPLETKTGSGFTALHMAAQASEGEVAKLLLDYGSDVNSRSTDGYTPLILAAGSWKSPIIRLLLDRGADINAKTNIGWTALMNAAWNGRYTAVQFLLGRGASRDGCTPQFSSYCDLQN